MYYVIHGNRVAWLSIHGCLHERPVFLSLAWATRRFLWVGCEREILMPRPTFDRAIQRCQSRVSKQGVIACYKSLQSTSIKRRCTYVTTIHHCNPYGT